MDLKLNRDSSENKQQYQINQEMNWKTDLPIPKEREAPSTFAEKTQRTAGKNPKMREAVASKKTA